ncbi:MAG: tetratricopeptide repeat protein [Flavobacteriales bacterium]
MKIFVILSLICLNLQVNGQKQEFDKGLKFFQKGKYKQALKWLDDSIGKDPTHALVRHIRGGCHFELQDYESAIKDFKAASLLEPQNPMHTYNVGLCHQLNGDNSMACSNYTHFLNLVDSDGEIDLNMAERIGTAFYFCGDMNLAENYLKLALRMGSEDSSIPNNLAWTYTQTGKYKEAIKLFKDAYDLDPTAYQNVNNLGYAYYLDDQLAKAEEYILEAKNLNADNSFVYRNLGLIRMKQQKKEEACAFLQKALDLDILVEWGEFYVQELLQYCN